VHDREWELYLPTANMKRVIARGNGRHPHYQTHSSSGVSDSDNTPDTNDSGHSSRGSHFLPISRGLRLPRMTRLAQGIPQVWNKNLLIPHAEPGEGFVMNEERRGEEGGG
jgi:hypothetical protein